MADAEPWQGRLFADAPVDLVPSRQAALQAGAVLIALVAAAQVGEDPPMK